MRTINKDLSELLPSTDLSENIVSYVTNVEGALFGSFIVVTTGTNTGELKIQYSNADVGEVADIPEESWVNDAVSPPTYSGAGTYFFPSYDIYNRWMRLVWTHDSGTGAITTCDYFAKIK